MQTDTTAPTAQHAPPSSSRRKAARRQRRDLNWQAIAVSDRDVIRRVLMLVAEAYDLSAQRLVAAAEGRVRAGGMSPTEQDARASLVWLTYQLTDADDESLRMLFGRGERWFASRVAARIERCVPRAVARARHIARAADLAVG